ncbi:hypothetical protein OIU77_020923 [Salix suchowensis]|uniref:Pentatricopeptide repeat-containing protein n=1 Tax=Salix suchowensis TaxID=1278906 RepID=A0ABQ9CAY3_9ROSI|nr:hypothetical protein OIU77_020923 [Salix suchowensis]
MYVKCRQINDAYNMFDRMPERDLICWNTIISRYAQNEFAKVALMLVLRMPEEGHGLDLITIVSILPVVVDIGLLKISMTVHGYVLRAEFEPLVNVLVALVDMHSKYGSARIC